MIPKICQIQIERWYLISLHENPDIHLHIFVDASTSAYASVAYLRVRSCNGVSVRLIGSKTKVAPLRPMSVPRLELQGAVLGVRHAQSIAQGHTIDINKVVFWTDSQTVLKWLNASVKKFKQFVSLRIGEILEHSDVNQWRWIPTKLNVADEATKAYNNPDISSSSRWVLGPDFLRLDSKDWPESIQILEDEWDEELKVVAALKESKVQRYVSPNLFKFSNWIRLVRVQAWVKRYFNNLHPERPRSFNTLSPLEIVEAQNYLFKVAQYDVFSEEIRLLEDNPDCIFPKTSRLRKLSPYIDEIGLIRVRGRIDLALNIPFEHKRPIILPSKHQITILVMRHYHNKYHHIHSETALNEISQRFVIRRLRAEMKRLRMECQSCKNACAKPSLPEMGELPQARLASFSLPFTYTGVDLFGPLHVTVNRHVEKRYGGLFTCLTTRAIHLELIESLNTSSYINGLRCFINRRGCPRAICSDNATNFKGANNELRDEILSLNMRDVEDMFAEIDFRFIPPASPHMGGSWERLVRSVKRVLAHVLHNKKPRVEILRTALIEVEGIMNSRPLTYVPVEYDAPEAITPNHFLLLSSSGIKPPGVFDDSPRTLEANWRMSQQLADQYWRRWVQEYLPSLTRRSKWHEKVQPIQVGDVVVIFEEALRNSWRKGIVIDTNKGSGGQVRSVIVKTQSGIYTRPVTKIAVLDVKSKPAGQLEEFTGGV